MSWEIEVKLRVASHEPVRDRLRSLGAISVGRAVETNEIFDRPDGSLRRKGYGLRIRSLEVDEGGDARATLTVKGPRMPGPVKSRQEAEVNISDARTAAAMLGMLGFVRILCYEKRRESWTLDRCRIELDEPPHIGLFVEIEGPDQDAIRNVQERLGLSGTAEVQASYVGMLSKYCDEHGVAGRVLRLTPPHSG